MRFKRSYPLFAIALSLVLLGANMNLGWSQSRRQPPTSNEKKNKRPGETQKPGEPGQEPLPKDLEPPTSKQDIEKVSISTQIVNVDAVVYHKKSGQIVTDLKKANFAIFADGTQQTITNFSTPEAPITVAMVVEYSKWSEMFGLYGSRGYEPGTYEVIVGEGAQAAFAGLAEGTKLDLPQGRWVVTGSFKSKGDAGESQLLTDAPTLMSAMRATRFKSVTVGLTSATAFVAFKKALTTNPALSVTTCPR